MFVIPCCDNIRMNRDDVIEFYRLHGYDLAIIKGLLGWHDPNRVYDNYDLRCLTKDHNRISKLVLWSSTIDSEM